MKSLPKRSDIGMLLLMAVGAIAVPGARLSGATPVFQWSTVAGRSSVGSDDGAAAKARFFSPRGLALNAAGNLYIADQFNCTIRKITPAGVVSTVAGTAGLWGSADGIGSAARFNGPEGVTADASGNLYVSDTINHTIRKISPDGTVTTLAGVPGTAGMTDGAASTALFTNPRQLGVDGSGKVYVLDGGVIRQIANGQVKTIYQSGGSIAVTNYNNEPVTMGIWVGEGLAVDSSGQLFFAARLVFPYSPTNSSTEVWAILKRDVQGGISLVFGGPQTFTGSGVIFRQLATDGAGNFAVLGQSWREVEGERDPVYRFKSDGTVTRSDSIDDATGDAVAAHGVALSATGGIYYSRDDNTIFRLGATGTATLFAGRPSNTVLFPGAWSLAVDAAGNSWIADEERAYLYGNPTDAVSLKKVTADGTVTTVIPLNFDYLGYANSTPLVAADGSRGVGFLHGKFSQNTLTRITPDGAITDAPTGLKPRDGNFVEFVTLGLAFDSSGNPVIPDSYGHAIWRRSPDGTWAVLAGKDGESGNADGTGTGARFNSFQTITTDRSGNFYVLDSTNAASGAPETSFIRRITPAGVVTTVSGNLVQPSFYAGASTVQPIGLAIDSKGAFYLTYPGLNSVWRLEPGGTPAPVGGVAGSRGDNDGLGTAAHFMSPAGVAVDAQDRLLVLDSRAGMLRRAVPLFGPTIAAQPQSASVAVGGAVQFSVTASGTPEPTYQWNFNGAAIAGATGNNYTIGGVQPVNAGGYSVTVTNSVGSATSSTAVLTIAVGGGNSGGGGGGGGGAPGIWFYAALIAAAIARFGFAKPTRAPR